MLSKSLFKQDIKSNLTLWAVVTIVMCLLVAQFVAMTEGVMDLTTTVFYGMMSIIVPAIFAIISSNGLLASQVDNGSMAYTLSCPIKRKTVVFTHVLFSALSLLVTFVLTTIIHFIVAKVMNVNTISNSQIIYLNIGSYLAVLSIAGVCFMFSGIFNRSKYSLACGGGLTVFFILMSMMALFGGLAPSMKALANFKYVTVVSLYDTSSILAGGSIWIIKAALLLVISFATYAVGSAWFCKKDLPL